MAPSIFPTAATLAVLCLLPPGCERKAPAPPAPAVPGPASAALFPAPVLPAPLSLEDEYLRLRSLYSSLPAVFRDEPGRSIEDLARDVESGIESAERILDAEGAAGGGIASLGGPARGDVEYMLAHLLYISFNRAVSLKKAGGLELAGRGLDLLRCAAIDLPPSSPRAGECLLLAGRLYLKRAAYQSEEGARRRDLASTRECLREYLSVRPDNPDRSSLHLNVADSHLMEGNYREARSYLEAVLREEPLLPGAFSLQERLFDALTGCGDLEAMEDLVRRRLSGYPGRLEAMDPGSAERKAMELWLDVGDFWLGHIRYALGDIDGARDCFLRQVDRVDRKETLLKARGEKLGDAARIFRDFRSRKLLTFLKERQGKRPSLDFDFGDLWCTVERTTLEASRGKVLAALFRNPGDQRSADFLRSIDALLLRERARGLEGIVAAFLWGAESPAEQVQAMKEDLKTLGVLIPAGIDPDANDPKIFRAMGAIVGSPSFIAFDRAGRIAWFLPDPRPMDAGIAERVLERLLAEPPPR